MNPSPRTHVAEERSASRTLPKALHGRVLVVDDHLDTCELFVESLRHHGCSVDASVTADHALEVLDASPPDVVITDVQLDGMSGIELCRRIAERAPDLPVIVITGHGSLDSAVAAIRAGAYDFITKPVELDVLVVAVHRALEHRALRREVREGIEQVRRSETSFRALIEQSPDLVSVVRDGKLAYVNAALRRSLGYEEAPGLLGKPLADVLHAGDVGGATTTSKGAASRELRWLRADGNLLVTEAVAIDVTFDGRPAVAVIAHDLSELLLMQARLLQADRMASLGTLAAGAAHEINNPLTYVLLNADVVDRGLGALAASLSLDAGEPRARIAAMQEATARVVEGAGRVRDIVANLKTFSRGEVDRRTAVDVRALVESSIAMVIHEIRPRARLTKDLAEVRPVLANEARLGQVFVNLLINAVQAIPAGSADEHEIHVATGTDPGGRVFVEVRDSGVGIAPAVIGRIFDPFFTTKPIGLGTGLGLSICHGIISSLGGEITASSGPNGGSTFRVTVPAATSAIAAVEAEPAVAPTTVRPRVLVVDDERAIGDSLQRALREELDVTSLHAARDALERIAGGDRFDVILCDVSMPIMTGMDLYAELTRVAPDQAARMIFMTGGAFTGQAQEFLAHVPTACIDKPLHLAQLRAEIARVMEIRRD